MEIQSTFKHIHTLTVQTITGNAAHWRSSCCGIMTGSKHRSRHRRSGDFTRAAADRRPPIQSFRSNSRARKFLIGRTLCLSNKCKKETVRSIGQFLCFYKRKNINVRLSQQRQVLKREQVDVSSTDSVAQNIGESKGSVHYAKERGDAQGTERANRPCLKRRL